jgi:hypothetical protein
MVADKRFDVGLRLAGIGSNSQRSVRGSKWSLILAKRRASEGRHSSREAGFEEARVSFQILVALRGMANGRPRLFLRLEIERACEAQALELLVARICDLPRRGYQKSRGQPVVSAV